MFSCVDKNLTEEDLIINSIKQVSPSVVSISIEPIDSKQQVGLGSGIWACALSKRTGSDRSRSATVSASRSAARP